MNNYWKYVHENKSYNFVIGSQVHIYSKYVSNTHANHDFIQLIFRYANQISVGNEVLVKVNDKLIPTKVIKIASMKVQGIPLCNTLNFSLFFIYLRFSWFICKTLKFTDMKRFSYFF